MKKEKDRTELEIACFVRAQALCIKPPKITQMVAALILGLAFYTEYPEGVINAVNIFILPEIYLEAGTEAALVAQRWDTELHSNILMSYDQTDKMTTKQRIYPIVGWEGAAKILDQWLVLIKFILGPPEIHPALHEISVLVEVTGEVSARLRAQA